MTAAERIQEKIQKLRALHAVLTGALNELSYDFLHRANKVIDSLPALLDVAEAAEDYRRAHIRDEDIAWEELERRTMKLDAALQRLGEPDA